MENIFIRRDSKGRFIKGCNIAKINKGIKKPSGFGVKISNIRKGLKLSDETKKKMSLSKIGNKFGVSNLLRGSKSGENSLRWIKDRSLLKKEEKRNDSCYKDWRKQVWVRDKFTCRIADNNCDGRIEAHHILGWSEYPELRYKINNGITLCHAHHPKRRAEEKRLISTFQELVSVSQE